MLPVLDKQNNGQKVVEFKLLRTQDCNIALVANGEGAKNVSVAWITPAGLQLSIVCKKDLELIGVPIDENTGHIKLI